MTPRWSCCGSLSFLLPGVQLPRKAPENIHTTDTQIVGAARFISAHYMDPITAADISKAAGYSPNYLSRRFKQAVGIGVHQYLMFIRLQHVAHVLLSTDDSVTEIALRCGFVSSNYMGDAFKNAYGVGPREYRKGEVKSESPLPGKTCEGKCYKKRPPMGAF